MKIGLIINPIAGMGGKAGLKGTDGAEVLAQAISLGAKRESASRTEQVLLPLARLNRRFSIMTCSGEMGEDTCKKIYKEETNAFCYYVITSILMNFFDKTFQWFNLQNTNLFFFNNNEQQILLFL